MSDSPCSWSAHARLAQLAESRADEVFLREVLPDRGSMSFRELSDRSARLASVLRERGVAPGDRVFLQIDHRWEFLAGFFACSMLGAVAVPFSPRASADDTALVLSQTQPSVALADVGASSPSVLAELEAAVAEIIDVGGAEGRDGRCELDLLLADADPIADPALGEPADLLAILPRSGTTGWLNGVMLTQANFRYAGVTYAEAARIRRDDRLLISLPLSHITAVGNMLMAALWSGASVGFSTSTRTWLETARRQGSTVGNLIAREVVELVSNPVTDEEASDLRVVMFGPWLEAAPQVAFEARFGTELRLGYGSTEAVSVIALNRPGMPPDYRTVGEVLAPERVRVVDERDEPVPPGTPGRLLVSGRPGVTLAAGYYGRPELTERTFGSGWLDTGDIVSLELDGRLQFLGRSSDFIKPTLATVSAAEVERTLKEHAGVIDASVIGVSEPNGHEVVTAFIVFSPFHPDMSVAELVDWLSGRLTEEKIPSAFHVLDALPYNEIGKVSRPALLAVVDR